MVELWKSVEVHPGYMVSNLGNVLSNASRRVLKPWKTRHGYMQVNLEGHKRVYVHRIVAAAWCGSNREPQVNHIDGDKQNNVATNLEWVTASQNQKHRFTHLGHQGCDLGKFGADHPTSKPVIGTNLKTGAKTRYESAMDAVREGFKSGSISRCCTGRYESHYGHSWSFAPLRGIVLPAWTDQQ